MIWWWSWLLTAVGATGLYFAGRKKYWGWAIGIFAQALWLTYSITTEQYGFTVSCFIYGSVYVKNFRAWRRDHRITTAPGQLGERIA